MVKFSAIYLEEDILVFTDEGHQLRLGKEDVRTQEALMIFARVCDFVNRVGAAVEKPFLEGELAAVEDFNQPRVSISAWK